MNTDGNEIADLQEAMRSDSSAVSPHLIWQWGQGAMLQPSQRGPRADVAQHRRLCAGSRRLRARNSARGASKLSEN